MKIGMQKFGNKYLGETFGNANLVRMTNCIWTRITNKGNRLSEGDLDSKHAIRDIRAGMK